MLALGWVVNFDTPFKKTALTADYKYCVHEISDSPLPIFEYDET